MTVELAGDAPVVRDTPSASLENDGEVGALASRGLACNLDMARRQLARNDAQRVRFQLLFERRGKLQAEARALRAIMARKRGAARSNAQLELDRLGRGVQHLGKEIQTLGCRPNQATQTTVGGACSNIEAAAGEQSPPLDMSAGGETAVLSGELRRLPIQQPRDIRNRAAR